MDQIEKNKGLVSLTVDSRTHRHFLWTIFRVKCTSPHTDKVQLYPIHNFLVEDPTILNIVKTFLVAQ